ncbi:MAG: ferredoxin, partial [Clostridiales bacterium]
IVYAVYFSPTHASQRLALAVAGGIAATSGMKMQEVDLTLPGGRLRGYQFQEEDIAVLAFPVYAGRMPLVLAEYCQKLQGQNTAAIPVAVYGNRAYDDALVEAIDLLGAQGLVSIAAAAFIGEHSLTAKLAAGRPDATDRQQAAAFGIKVAAKIGAGDKAVATVNGHRPYVARKPVLDLRPETKENCVSCGLCAKNCPMAIIDFEHPAQVSAGCIRCSACVKFCPVAAKHFTDPTLAALVQRLESNFCEPRQPELFL